MHSKHIFHLAFNQPESIRRKKSGRSGGSFQISDNKILNWQFSWIITLCFINLLNSWRVHFNISHCPSVHRIVKVILLLLLLLRHVFSPPVRSNVGIAVFVFVHCFICICDTETRQDETRRDDTRRDVTPSFCVLVFT